MRAEFDSKNFSVYLDTKTGELELLGPKHLSARLIETHPYAEDNLEKQVILSLGKTRRADGIDVDVSPGDALWKDIREVQIVINQRAYSYIVRTGSFQAEYGSLSKKRNLEPSHLEKKVKIYNGLPDARLQPGNK